MKREEQSSVLPDGALLPHFKLPSTTGVLIDTKDFAPNAIVVVAFICNHCPYVKGSDHELIALVNEFNDQGPSRFVAVGISSNDAEQYPEDGFDLMQVKSVEMNLPYQYLYDETQEVAKLFDAVCTPEYFLFDQRKHLVFHGAINDSPRDASKVTKHFLRDALEALFEGKKPTQSYAHSIGCSIKWK